MIEVVFNIYKSTAPSSNRFINATKGHIIPILISAILINTAIGRDFVQS
jgi:hypothetical protein